MATWKAREKGFHGGRIREVDDVFEAPDGEDIVWADPADGQRPTPAPVGPKADTFAGIQSGPKVLDLTAKLEAADARVAELEAALNEARNAAPAPVDDSDIVKSLKGDLKAAQKRIVTLEADAKTKDDLLAAKDVEYQEMMKNRDDWKQAYDDLVAEHQTDHPEDPG